TGGARFVAGALTSDRPAEFRLGYIVFHGGLVQRQLALHPILGGQIGDSLAELHLRITAVPLHRDIPRVIVQLVLRPSAIVRLVSLSGSPARSAAPVSTATP